MWYGGCGLCNCVIGAHCLPGIAYTTRCATENKAQLANCNVKCVNMAHEHYLVPQSVNPPANSQQPSSNIPNFPPRSQHNDASKTATNASSSSSANTLRTDCNNKYWLLAHFQLPCDLGPVVDIYLTAHLYYLLSSIVCHANFLLFI